MFLLTMLWLGCAGRVKGFGQGLSGREITAHVATVTGLRLASFM
eukprot:COSAG06_NODE_10393_length_1688_cov_5.625070_1_plen_43_part_10